MSGLINDFFLKNADQNNINSISYKLRNKRKELFLKFIIDIPKPLRILDLGGSEYFWRNLNLVNLNDLRILLVNTEFQDVNKYSNMDFLEKDVKDLSEFGDKEFDIVHSNSLIEHISSAGDQKKLAEEIVRIGKHYFIQTPNYFFPFEPHFMFPFFQFLPHKKKVDMIMKKDLGWYKRETDFRKADELASSVRLLKKKELKNYFKGAKIYSEKYFLFTKSFIVYN
ncbi:MAG: class I SAM-dependent methyltransferase [Ignavibacteria bacterium]|nr:class I SAM-dependent methyltransferase [Ignavibacteria bacterium]